MSAVSSLSPSVATSPAVSTGSPRVRRLSRPTLRDVRLLAGAACVLISIVLGSSVVAAADERTQVWSLTVSLPQGALVTEADVALVPVAMDSTEAYATEGRSPVGRRLAQAVGAGELIAISALKPTIARDLRQIAVPVAPQRIPVDLARGSRVDLWSTPGDGAGGFAPSVRVVANATVAAVPSADDLVGGGEVSVLLDIPSDEVGEVVRALRAGAVDVVAVTSS